MVQALRRWLPLARRQEATTAVATMEESIAYLEKRRAILAYARCQAQGYPIGSESVESANKVVMEARLKRLGMY